MDGFAARRSRFRAVSVVDARTRNGTMRTSLFRPAYRLAKSVDCNNLDPQDGSRERKEKEERLQRYTQYRRERREDDDYIPPSVTCTTTLTYTLLAQLIGKDR